MNRNQNSLHIIGQDNRMMPLYQAFDKYLNVSVEDEEINPRKCQSITQITVALPDPLDGIVARQIINNTKTNRNNSKNGTNKEEASIDDKIFPVIHKGMNISDVVEGIHPIINAQNDDEELTNTKIYEKAHLNKPIDAIWLNYIDGKVFNARDLRHSKYWKDLNSLLRITVEQRKHSKLWKFSLPVEF